jgi:hypothetical protein
MKKTKIIYWIFTGLFAAFMAFSAIPDVLLTDEAVAFMKTLLGLPNYLTQFIGIAKLLEVIAILIPGFPRIKEWAYAGFAFDLIGAVYCVIAAGGMNGGVFFMLVPITLGTVSYIYFHKKWKEESAAKSV